MNRIYLLISIVLVCFAKVVVANDTPSIDLFTFNGERQIVQSAQDPLLLYINLSNSVAVSNTRLNARNQAMLNRFAQTDAYKALSDKERDELSAQYPTLEVPKFELGSKALPLSNLLNFQVRNSKGEPVDLDIRPLLSTQQHNNIITLDEDNGLVFVYVVETQELTALDTDTYHFVSSINTQKASGMWQGYAYSNDIKVILHEQHPESDWPQSNDRAMLLSAFLLGDQQFANAEQQALNWAKQLPDSVDAWSALGDAFAGQNKNAETLQAYKTAMQKFYLKNGRNAPEAPRELIKKIDALDDE